MLDQRVLGEDHSTVVRWLDDTAGVSLAEAGGKGANLAELIQAGLPVPPAFVVTAQAYEVHLRSAGLEERIAGRLRGLPADDLAAASAASRDIVSWIEAAPMPEPVGAAVTRAYADLASRAGSIGVGGVSVAVRSSATAEDLPSASFAGQQETYLNVRGADAVLKAVRRCWASLWTPQALTYRAGMGFDHLKVELAVVVQAMVPAEIAGVMFTANPVTGARDEILISASYGLGEAVVSGAITPDTFVVATDGLVRQRTLGSKLVRIVPNGIGTRTEEVPAADRARFSLRDADLVALSVLARRVQSCYGSPQDTEWALSRGRLYLLQARPITTLDGTAASSEDTQTSADEPPINRKMTGAQQMFEYWPEPPTPLDVSFFRESAAGMNALYRMLGLAPDPRLPEPVERPDGRIAVRAFNPRFSPALLWKIPVRLLVSKGDPLDRWQPVAGDMMATVGRWEAAEAAATGPVDLARLVGQEMREFGQLLGRRFETVFMSGIQYLLLLKLWARLGGGKASAQDLEDRLLRATPFRTALQNKDAARLAQLAKAHGKDSPEFQAAWTEFLAAWGSRTAAGMVPMPSVPVWREKPAQVLDLVDALLSDPDAAAAEDEWRAQEADYRAARAEVEARLWVPLRGLYRKSVDRARHGVVAREDSLYRMEILMAHIRATALHLGERLARAGILDQRDDVFYLLEPELVPAAEGRLPVAERIRRRKQGYTKIVAANRRGQHWLISTGSIAAPTTGSRQRVAGTGSTDRKVITGLAASRGQVTGRVCVVHGPQEFGKLRKGDVLVAPFTAPAWTPLFRLASAVVTDIGNPTSHAAIVAREYGLPAVVATGSATSRLADGQQVRVDGTQGIVTLLRGDV